MTCVGLPCWPMTLRDQIRSFGVVRGGPEFDGAQREVLFYGQCQQKTVFGMKTSHE